MNDENTEYLVKTYPILYARRQYFACGDGWFNILKRLSEEIAKVVKEAGVECHCEDVKEKYGTLRYYFSPYNERISALVHNSEILSAETCENCGEPGSLFEGPCGWLSTLCEDCRKPK